MSLLNISKKNNVWLKNKGYLLICCDNCGISEWKMPDDRLGEALFRIHVAQKLIEFFELSKRGNEEAVYELLNPYERGVEHAINKVGYQYEHPDYEQGYKDYIAANKK